MYSRLLQNETAALLAANMLCRSQTFRTTRYFSVLIKKEHMYYLGCGVNVLAEWHWAMAEEAWLSSTSTGAIAWISKNSLLPGAIF